MPRILAPALLLAVSACTQSGLTDLSGTPSLEQTGEVIENEFVIGAEVPESLASDLGLELLRYDDRLGAGLWRAESGTDLWTLSTALKQDLQGDLLVEHNRPRVMSRVVNDEYRELQWNFDALDMNRAWDIATGAGVVVAVIDTGVAKLTDKPKNLVNGWDFVQDDANPRDQNGHGTHVAGTIAQATDNGVGCAGIAPDATILAVRVLDANGGGSSFDVASGITWAVDNGADVINLSLGSPSSTTLERQAIQDAAASGVVVVAASGNDGGSSVSYPAAYPEAIAVGATRFDGRVTGYSNRGSALDVVAPGGDTTVDQNNDGYGDGILQETLGGFSFFEGTSMASPHVAGVAALLLSAGASPEDVRDILVSTASNNGTFSTSSGYGLIDPVAALESMTGGGGGGGGGGGSPPPPSDTTPPTISNVDGWRSADRLDLVWTTNEPATTQISFQGYGSFDAGTGLTTDHAMSFWVDRNETYYFTIVAEDAEGNVGTSGVWQSSP